MTDSGTAHPARQRGDALAVWQEILPADVPNPRDYTSAECFVAGRLSTMYPFDMEHPACCLPFARAALEALSEWEPDDG